MALPFQARIEVAMVQPDRKGNTTMATIGTFTKNDRPRDAA